MFRASSCCLKLDIVANTSQAWHLDHHVLCLTLEIYPTIHKSLDLHQHVPCLNIELEIFSSLSEAGCLDQHVPCFGQLQRHQPPHQQHSAGGQHRHGAANVYEIAESQGSQDTGNTRDGAQESIRRRPVEAGQKMKELVNNILELLLYLQWRTNSPWSS